MNRTIGKNIRGVTLTLLVIVIIVMIILAGAALKVTDDLTTESKLTTFASDLSDIEDATMAYYISNNEWPVTADEALSSIDFEALVTGDVQTDLIAEINANGDQSDTFSKIDLSKLSVTSTSKGNGASNTDYYYVSTSSHRVYYLSGLEVKDVNYFSLTSDLINKTNVVSNITPDTSSVSITSTVNSISVTKSNNFWTNSLNVTVSANLETGEKWRCKIANIITENEQTANKTITINAAYLASYSISTSTFYSDNILVIEKYTTSGVAATATVNLSNLDFDAPSVPNVTPTTTISVYNTFNTLSFTENNLATDIGGSGLKEIRYEYLEKYTLDGVEPYYTNQTPIADMDAEYMLNAGKKSNNELIKLPKHVKTIAVCWVDNAGNVSVPISYSITDLTMLQPE